MKKISILTILVITTNSVIAGFAWSSSANPTATEVAVITPAACEIAVAALTVPVSGFTLPDRPQVPRLDFSRIRAIVDSPIHRCMNTPAPCKPVDQLTKTNPVRSSTRPHTPRPVEQKPWIHKTNVKRDRRNGFASDRRHFKG